MYVLYVCVDYLHTGIGTKVENVQYIACQVSVLSYAPQRGYYIVKYNTGTNTHRNQLPLKEIASILFLCF